MSEQNDPQATQPLMISPIADSENTQPIAVVEQTAENTQDTQKLQVVNEPNPLPDWILNWARESEDACVCDHPTEIEFELEKPFQAPQLSNQDVWQVAEEPSRDPLQDLEHFLIAGDYMSVKTLVEKHNNNPDFQKSGSIAIRKHLSIEEEYAQLWEAYEILKNK